MCDHNDQHRGSGLHDALGSIRPTVFDVLGLFFFMKMFFTFVLAFVWYFESHDRFLLSCVLLELLQKKLQHLFSLALFLARSPVSDQLLMTCNKPTNEVTKGLRES